MKDKLVLALILFSVALPGQAINVQHMKNGLNKPPKDPSRFLQHLPKPQPASNKKSRFAIRMRSAFPSAMPWLRFAAPKQKISIWCLKNKITAGN